MSAPLQSEHRLASIEIEGLPDLVVLDRLQGTEAISQLFRFELDLISESQGIPFGSVVGRKATLTIGLEQAEKFEEEERKITGIVSQFSHERVPKTAWDAYRVFRYRAVVVPDLWLLTQTTTSRIFEQKSVQEIVHAVCKAHQVQLDWRHTRELATREYCVQYGETDFAFVCRLLEDEGLHFYFGANRDGIPACIVSDAEAADEVLPSHGRIERMAVREEIRANRLRIGDYDFANPDSGEWSGEIYRTSQGPRIHGSGTRELFEYPAGYEKLGADALEIARRRMEEEEAQITVITGEGTGWGLAAGLVFDVGEWDHEDLNEKPFRMLSVRHRLRHARLEDVDLEATGAPREGSDDHYENWFECIPRELPFRPPRVTQKPRMRGPQTAIVIGRDAQAGHGTHNSTDRYGRVRVRFPWARADEASCWIRVSQAWAGKQWGAMQIPHAGQEVIVDFLDGDPDRPIITGRVYNAKNRLPELDQDAHPHQTVMRDDYGNEIVLDATPGDEHIRLYSPHHNSGIVLGRSMSAWSDSDQNDDYRGNKREFGVGNFLGLRSGSTFEFAIGASFEAQLATAASLLLGSEVSAHLGPAYGLRYGAELDFIDGDDATVADGDNIIVANEFVNLIGGAASAKSLPEGPMSILHAGQHHLMLSLGKNKSPEKKGGTGWHVASGAAYAAAAVLAVITMSVTAAKSGKPAAEVLTIVQDAITGIAAALTILFGALGKDSIQRVSHEDNDGDDPDCVVKLWTKGNPAEGIIDILADEIRIRGEHDLSKSACFAGTKYTPTEFTVSGPEIKLTTEELVLSSTVDRPPGPYSPPSTLTFDKEGNVAFKLASGAKATIDGDKIQIG